MATELVLLGTAGAPMPVAERAGVGDLILNHYLPAEPEAITNAEWAARAGRGFSGRTTAGFDGLRRKLVGAKS